MSKFRLGALSFSFFAICSTALVTGAEPALKDVELPPESQLTAPETAPMPDFSSTASTVYNKRRASAQLPAVHTNTTNAKSGVQTPPEEMTSVFVPAPSAVSGATPAEGAWQVFVKQWLDMNKPGYLGNLLSSSQQTDIIALDTERKQLDDRLADATASGALAQPLQDQLRAESTSIAALESSLIKSDALSYEEATDILFRLNMLKASLDAASHGRTKPLLSDYFNDKDPISYRDHLLRKLFYFRLNGRLSDGEYDELRASVNHVSEHLATVGQQVDSVAILESFKKIDAKISTMADELPTASSAQHFGKKI
ncbi:MAG: hypothetical protein P4L53_05045 [Candidatus Obscuribacterales bacterium]|nr:hypothetical protein [Candidatus Obscuribacterales bacterium]